MPTCRRCSRLLPLAAFTADTKGPDGYARWCRDCKSDAFKEWSEKNKEKLRLKGLRRRELHRDELNAQTRSRSARMRDAVFSHYGKACTCCGTSHLAFLTIDHIHDDGAQHRKEVGSGSRLYEWLVKNNFPEGFRTLCYNCNSGRYRNGGICPHQQTPLWDGIEGASTG